MLELNLSYIKKRRTELGITQKEVATALGMKNASTYLKYENGDYSLKAEMLPILAQVLKCKIANFFVENVAKTAI